MRISAMLLKRRKIFGGIIIFVIAVSAILNIMSGVLTQAVLQYKWEKAVQSYGLFSCGISLLSEEEYHSVLEYIDERNIGKYEAYKSVVLSGTPVTLGSADERFCNMTGAKLVSGRLPQKEGEIIVEKFVADILGKQNIIEVEEQGRKVPLKIVGVVENYSAGLSLPENIETGKNTYPNIICAQNNIFQKDNKKQSFLLNLENAVNVSKGYTENAEKIYGTLEKANIPAEKIFLNNGLLSRGLESCNEIWKYSIFFSCAVVALMAICGYMLLNIFFKDYRKKLAILQICGFSSGKVILIIAQQLAIFIALGKLSGFLLSLLLLGGYKYKITFDRISFAVAGVIVWIAVACMILFKYKLEVTRYSPAENLSNKGSSLIEKKQPENIMKNIQKADFKMALLLGGVFVISYASLYIYSITIYGNPKIPDYQVFSKEVEVSEIVNGFTVKANSENVIRESDGKKLETYASDITYELWPEFNGCTILFEKNKMPKYFEEWNLKNHSEDTGGEDSFMRKNLPAEMKHVAAVENVDFIVANDNMMKNIISQYKLDVSLEQLDRNKEVVLFLPEYSDDEKGVNKNEQIHIGGIEQYKKEVRSRQDTFRIGGIVGEKYQLKTGNEIQEREGIIVLLSEKTAAESGLFRGYRALAVRLNKHVPEKEKEEIRDMIYGIAAKNQGGILYSKKVLEEDEKIFTSYNKALSVILLSVNLLAGGVGIIILVYQSVLRNERKYGILRTLGLSLKKLRKDLWTSLFKSLFLAYICGTAVILVFVGSIEELLYYWRNYFVAVGQLFILQLIACLVIFRLSGKWNIRNMIEER